MPLWRTQEEAKEQAAYGFAHCDILKISDNEIQWFTGEEDLDTGMKKLRHQYEIPLILLSMGKEGSRAYYRDLRIKAAPYLQENTIETTGAGDTFCACCLHFILNCGLDGLNKEILTEMLKFSNAAASIITTRRGALRVMPTKKEIKTLMDEYMI